MLYRLSYSHHGNRVILLDRSRLVNGKGEYQLARQEGFEPSTHGLEGRCSVLLSYWRNGRGERIRTSDPLLPRQVRYQAALRPDKGRTSSIDTNFVQPEKVGGPAIFA